MWKEELKRFDWYIYAYIVILGIISLVLVLTVQLPFREVFLNDADLWRTPTPDTISMGLVIVFAAVLAIMIFGVEYFICRNSNPSQALYAAIRVCLGFIMVNIFTAAVTGFLKIYVAEARPDFLSRCLGETSIPPLQYTTQMINSLSFCNPSSDSNYLKDGLQAWPSGHSSTSLCSAAFFLFYLSWRSRKLPSAYSQLIWILSSIPLILAFFIGASRIVDNKHSTADVCSGFLLGLVAAIAYLIPLLTSVDAAYYDDAKREREY